MAVEDHLPAAAQEDSVVVAVNVRPLIDLELAEGCKPCLHVTPGEPQVGPWAWQAGGRRLLLSGRARRHPTGAAAAAADTRPGRLLACPDAAHSLSLPLSITQVGHGAHLFRYDHVFGDAFGAEPAAALYGRCVAPLVDGLLKGYNATVLAYGQTGSGKTYTMGSAFSPGGADSQGVIPAVMEAVFCRMAEAPADIDFTVRVGFVEIHKVCCCCFCCQQQPQT